MYQGCKNQGGFSHTSLQKQWNANIFYTGTKKLTLLLWDVLSVFCFCCCCLFLFLLGESTLDTPMSTCINFTTDRHTCPSIPCTLYHTYHPSIISQKFAQLLNSDLKRKDNTISFFIDRHKFVFNTQYKCFHSTKGCTKSQHEIVQTILSLYCKTRQNKGHFCLQISMYATC